MNRLSAPLAALSGRWHALPERRRRAARLAVVAGVWTAATFAWHWVDGERQRLRASLASLRADEAAMRQRVAGLPQLAREADSATKFAGIDVIRNALGGQGLDLSVTLGDGERFLLAGQADFDRLTIALAVLHRDYRLRPSIVSVERVADVLRVQVTLERP